MYIDQQYVKGNYHMPDFENTPKEKKKTAEYNIGVGQWMYHLHMNNKTAIPHSLESYHQLCRLYGEGRQPKEIYEKTPRKNNSTSPTELYDREVKRKGIHNQNDKIVSLMPKIKSVVIPDLKSIDFDIQCDAVDPVSGSEEEDKMMRVWMRSHYGGVLDQIAVQAGLPITNDEIFPEDSEDLRQLRMDGMFKPEHAIEVEEVIKHVFRLSKWDEDLSERFSNEALDTGYICGYSDYDYEEKSEKIYFAYPEDTIKQHSKSRMFDDSDFEGVCIDYSISTLRQIFPEVPLNEWVSLAGKYQGYNGNPTITNISTRNSLIEDTSQLNEYNIPVLVYQWIDVEKQEKVKYTTKKGRKVIADKDRTIDALHTKENLFTHRRRVKYGCKWIIGTGLAWDYGPFQNQPHKGSRPLSSVFVYRFPYEPLTQRLIPMMDDLQFAWLKYNDAMAKAFPGGIAIDISMINNISDSKNHGRKLDYIEVIKMMFNMGVLPYMPNPINVHGGGQGLPVMELPSTVLKSLTEYLNIINQIILMVETVTGLSPVALGGTPTADQAVKNTQLAYSATLKSLRHIIDGKSRFKQAISEYVAERMRILLEVDEQTRKLYESIIGVEGVYLISLAKKREAQYGIKMIARPTDEERQAVIEQANLSYQAHQQGQPGLNEGQRTRIIFMVSGGSNLKMVSRYMDMWIRKDKKEKEAEKVRMIQAQSEEIQKQELVKQQGEAQKNQMEFQKESGMSKIDTDNKIREITVEKELERRNDIAKRNAEYKQQLKDQLKQQQENAGVKV